MIVRIRIIIFRVLPNFDYLYGFGPKFVVPTIKSSRVKAGKSFKIFFVVTLYSLSVGVAVSMAGGVLGQDVLELGRRQAVERVGESALRDSISSK